MLRASFISVFIGASVFGCSPRQPTDPIMDKFLGQISETTSTYYTSLIQTYGTESCRYSAPLSQSFWTELENDMRVIETRAMALETNRHLRNSILPLRDRYELAHQQVALAEAQPSRTPEGRISSCLQPMAAVQTSESLLRELGSIQEISAFATVQTK